MTQFQPLQCSYFFLNLIYLVRSKYRRPPLSVNWAHRMDLKPGLTGCVTNYIYTAPGGRSLLLRCIIIVSVSLSILQPLECSQRNGFVSPLVVVQICMRPNGIQSDSLREQYRTHWFLWWSKSSTIRWIHTVLPHLLCLFDFPPRSFASSQTWQILFFFWCFATFFSILESPSTQPFITIDKTMIPALHTDRVLVLYCTRSVECLDSNVEIGGVGMGGTILYKISPDASMFSIFRVRPGPLVSFQNIVPRPFFEYTSEI